MSPDELIGPTVVHSMGSISYASSKFCALLDVDSSSDIQEQSLDQFVSPSDRDPLDDQFERIARNGTAELGLRLTLRCGDGSACDAIAVSSPVTWNGTSQIQTSFIELPRAEDRDPLSLRNSAIREAPIGIAVADVTWDDNPLVYVNDGFVKLTGYPREEALGRNCRFLQGENTRDEPVDAMRAAIDAEESVTVDLRNYRKDGSMFWNRVTLSPVENEAGEITHYLGFQEDISEMKAQEEERLLFETYAEKSDEVMFITNANGVIEYVNPAFEQVTEYDATEAIGKTPRILKSGEHGEEFYENLWQTILAGDTWQAEITNQTKSGELYDTTQEITPITDDRGEIRYFVARERDITKQQLRQQVLDVLNRILRHNVRNSVTVIDGYAELIESHPGDPTVEAAANTIREHATTLERLTERTTTIRNLIAVSEGEKVPSSVNVSTVETIAARYRDKYPGAIVELTLNGSPDSAIRHGAVFEIALKELIENAIEHNDQQTPRVEITITQSAETNEATIDIADNGPGISRAKWEIIKSGEETQLHHAEGVGLWVVYWSVTALGGKIELSANEPRGSVITLQVPLVTQSDHSETQSE